MAHMLRINTEMQDSGFNSSVKKKRFNSSLKSCNHLGVDSFKPCGFF